MARVFEVFCHFSIDFNTSINTQVYDIYWRIAVILIVKTNEPNILERNIDDVKCLI